MSDGVPRPHPGVCLRGPRRAALLPQGLSVRIVLSLEGCAHGAVTGQRLAGRVPETRCVWAAAQGPLPVPCPALFQNLICSGRVTTAANFGSGSDLGGTLSSLDSEIFFFFFHGKLHFL